MEHQRHRATLKSREIEAQILHFYFNFLRIDVFILEREQEGTCGGGVRWERHKERLFLAARRRGPRAPVRPQDPTQANQELRANSSLAHTFSMCQTQANTQSLNCEPSQTAPRPMDLPHADSSPRSHLQPDTAASRRKEREKPHKCLERAFPVTFRK